MYQDTQHNTNHTLGHSLELSVWAEGEADSSLLESLSRALNVPIQEHSTGLRLTFTDSGLTLHDFRHGKNPVGIKVDFVEGKAKHRRQFGGGRGQALARALGLKHGLSPHIVDCTAGMGRDAFVLASLGCPVTLIERNPITFHLLKDGLQRALGDKDVGHIASNMHLIQAHATQWLQDPPEEMNSPTAIYPKVIYLDPMYPHKEKSAKVKKEMLLFRDLAGDDLDASELLSVARDSDAARVVVKRPKGAPFLGDQVTHTQVESKNTRYDIYAKRKLEP